MRKYFGVGGTARGVLVMFGGAAGGQLVTFLALPLISRLFSPAEFGTLAFVMAVVGIVFPVATLRLETAAMLPRGLKQVRALVWLALCSTVVISGSAALVVYVLLRSGALKVEQDSGVGWWIATLSFLTATFTLFSQLALREKKYSLVAQRSFLQASITAVCQLALGIWHGISAGLLIGATLGRTASTLLLLRQVRVFLPFPGLAYLRQSWRDYWRFPAIFAPSALLNALGFQAPLLLLTMSFGISQAGQLGMAERIIAVPVALVGAVVGQAIDAEVSLRLRERSAALRPIYMKFSLGLSVVGLAVLVAGVTFGPLIVPWLLGENWKLAGELVQVLSVVGAIRLVASPMSKFILLLQKSMANTFLDLTRVFLLFASYAVTLWLEADLITSAWIIYSSLSVTYIVTWAYGAVLVAGSEPSE